MAEKAARRGEDIVRKLLTPVHSNQCLLLDSDGEGVYILSCYGPFEPHAQFQDRIGLSTSEIIFARSCPASK
jgi:hypothetical protein